MMDEECKEAADAAIIPILPACCLICNSPDATTNVNNTVIQATGSALAELVRLLVPDGRDELQLLPAICASCTAFVTEYDELRSRQRDIELYVRQQYAASQAARAALEVVIELGDNRVSVPYGVYREHRAAAAEQPPPAEAAAAPEQPPAAAAATATEAPPPPVTPPPAAPRLEQQLTELDLEIHVESGRQCHVCDARFQLFGELAVHLRDVHHLSGSEIRAVRSRSSAAPAAAPARPVPCPLCADRQFSSAERARAHLVQRHRRQLEAGVQLPAELAVHLCRHCGAAFRRADMCRKHEATHRARASAHACELCGKTLRYRHGLKRHLQSQHGLPAEHPAVARAAAPADRHPCDRCPRVFADFGQYLFHCRSEHLDEPDVGFTCELCDRRFEKRSELRLHRDAHRETSYSCVTCEKHFRTRLAYQKHMRTHEGGGVACQHCGKVFDTRSNLATHLQTHSARRQHVCADCGAAFKFGQTLARHRAVRHGSGTPRFVCDICGKAFPLEHSLNLHRSRHGPATLSCPRCPAQFTNRPDLRRHVRRLHTAPAADPLQRALLALTEDETGTDAAAGGRPL
ncbi:zinc finger protein 497-like [Amphibalanus amphitrite]|uniref:zinc finger protein 497-like n=1 Tax=Amphibalanus amphitrite TaxID=1232801 RepID=UPI001C918AF3|nr:zinc finger protein 497-like [Amphibalanus amphitrite]